MNMMVHTVLVDFVQIIVDDLIVFHIGKIFPLKEDLQKRKFGNMQASWNMEM